MAGSKRFHVDHDFEVGRCYGRRYVEFDTGAVRLALYKRRALAKLAGVVPDGSGSLRLTVGGDSGAFTDPRDSCGVGMRCA